MTKIVGVVEGATTESIKAINQSISDEPNKASGHNQHRQLKKLEKTQA